jgi:hypothetical protein
MELWGGHNARQQTAGDAKGEKKATIGKETGAGRTIADDSIIPLRVAPPARARAIARDQIHEPVVHAVLGKVCEYVCGAICNVAISRTLATTTMISAVAVESEEQTSSNL